MSAPASRPLRRALGDHRPQRDPACAGCPQLGLLRALRRTGVEADGRLSCEPPAGPVRADGPGAAPVLVDAARGEARLVILAGPDEPDPVALASAAAAPGSRVVRVAPDALAEVETAVREALGRAGTTVLVAVAPCQLEAPRQAPFAIAPARCNRCGSCLSLGCPAIEDVGGDAMVIDPAVCTGCARCAPMCRGMAIGSRG